MIIDRETTENVPLRVLFVLANPLGLPRCFDTVRTWEEITDALTSVAGGGSLVFERLGHPTEAGLKEALANTAWNVVHFVAHAQEQALVHHGTIVLQRLDGSARHMTAEPLAGLMAPSDSIRLVVLQPCDENSHPATLAESLVENGVPAVALLPAMYGKSARELIAKLYEEILAGISGEELMNHLAAGLPSAAAAGVKILGRKLSEPFYAGGTNRKNGDTKAIARATAALTSDPGMNPSPQPTLSERQVASPRLEATPSVETCKSGTEILKPAGETCAFDVFLCHNSVDKPMVSSIGERLKQAGIRPWLDIWELPPGHPWQLLLEQQIGDIRAAAVFVGPAGFGPWQQQEMRAFLDEFAKREAPVIPVLLPGVPAMPILPIFLRQMGWVDFRRENPDPLKHLIWGITGRRPDDWEGSQKCPLSR